MTGQQTVLVIDNTAVEKIATLEKKIDKLLEKVTSVRTSDSKPTSFGFMRIEKVLEVIPIGRSTWRMWVQEGRAPQGVFLSDRVKVWRVEDIRAFAEKLGREREVVA